MNKHYDNLCAVAKHFGLEAQAKKTAEEIMELYDELYFRNVMGVSSANTKSEIADVYNMLDQLCILMDCRNEVQEIAEAKMLRTMERYGISLPDTSQANYLIEVRDPRTGCVDRYNADVDFLWLLLSGFRMINYEIVSVKEEQAADDE